MKITVFQIIILKFSYTFVPDFGIADSNPCIGDKKGIRCKSGTVPAAVNSNPNVLNNTFATV